jgi:hypothetical protein
MLKSYPKLWAVGHKVVADIFQSDVYIEEKVDGSQFSFGKINGELFCRSKGALINLEDPEKMFKKGVEYVKSIVDKLPDNVTYRGEYLEKPKHNTLAYARIPNNHIIIFDIDLGIDQYMGHSVKSQLAAEIGLETVPLLGGGTFTSVGDITKLLEHTSILGGQKVEGVVVKNYNKFTIYKEAMFGKYVSEAFKEIHQGDWKDRNPGGADFITTLVAKYKTPARWNKAIQHLKEAGQIEGSPKDIGLLMKEIQRDTFEECKDEIMKDLYNWANDKLRRGIIQGFPEFYKQQLLESAFPVKEAVNE